ncbi:MAG: hypothetical protein LBB77_02075, partial [Treponema sp.]|nr:hypothetical protein [Treponema sp.]
VPQNIQLANFGSSHGRYDFEWSDSPYQAFNFGLDSQLHLYDYALLRQYSKHFDKNAVVIFLIEYFEIEMIKINYSDQIPRYYRILDKKYTPEYSFWDYIRYAVFPLLSAGDNIRLIVYDINPEVAFQKKWYSTMSEEELAEYSSKHHIDWTTDSPDGTTLQKGAEGFVHNQKILSDIIDYCLARELQPVLISTPITGIFNDVFEERTSDFFETFYRFSREISEKYPNVPYLDYSHDKRFENDISLFFDGDHLNIYGAKKFTSIVVEDIQSLGLLPIR